MLKRLWPGLKQYSPSLVPRPLPDFISHGCEIKSGNGLGTRLAIPILELIKGSRWSPNCKNHQINVTKNTWLPIWPLNHCKSSIKSFVRDKSSNKVNLDFHKHFNRGHISKRLHYCDHKESSNGHSDQSINTHGDCGSECLLLLFSFCFSLILPHTLNVRSGENMPAAKEGEWALFRVKSLHAEPLCFSTT